MSDLTWTEFNKKIFIHSPLEQLYRCWATKGGITSWFLKDAEFLRNGIPISDDEFLKTGDTYTWFWYNWDGHEKGIILEANDVNYLRFSFTETCEVEIRMEQKENAVLISLKQSNIPIDEKNKLRIFYGCSNGWTFWLANLKAYLEHGILLNETNIDLRGFDMAGYEFVNI